MVLNFQSLQAAHKWRLKQESCMLPLNGVRIVAVEQYGAGPFGTLFLANLGAEVIKVEDSSTGGDVSRGVGPFFVEGEEDDNNSLFFQGLNHNKRSISLNLRTEEGRKVFHELVKTADGLACNLRGDVPEKLGITYDKLKTVNPKIVCAHLSAYGREGDRKSWPGYDYPMQAEAGYFSLTGEPSAPPARFGLSLVDLSTGVGMALALVSGILEARNTGRGRDLDISLFDMALYNLNYVAMWQMNAGHNQGRVPRSAHFSLTPCQLYTSKDGWIYIMCNKEKFWGELCRRIDHEELQNDPRFSDFKQRLENRDVLTILLDEILMTKTTAEWLEIFDGQVPAAPILNVEEALSNPFVADTDRINTMLSESGETLKILKSPIRCGEDSLPLNKAPTLGGDTESILSELGYGKADIDRLVKDKAVTLAQ